eukprot:scaffold257759_cov28-Tisochrysis_lutea.AAC.1
MDRTANGSQRLVIERREKSLIVESLSDGVALIGANVGDSFLVQDSETLLVVLSHHCAYLLLAHAAEARRRKHTQQWHISIWPEYVAKPVLVDAVAEQGGELLAQSHAPVVIAPSLPPTLATAHGRRHGRVEDHVRRPSSPSRRQLPSYVLD